MTKLLEKHNVEVQRAIAKYTHTASVEAFKEEFAKHLFNPIDAQELHDSEKVSAVWVKNLRSIENKMNNTNSSMIDLKPKDPIKLGTVERDKSKTYPEEKLLPEDGLYRYLYQLVNKMEIKKDELLTLSVVKIHIK